MQLREHQYQAIEMLRQSFKAGNRKVLLAAPCSFGKTHTAAYMCKQVQDRGGRAVFFADRIKLIDQTLEAFDQWGIDYGVMQADHWLANPNAPIQIASIQTVTRRGWQRLDFDLGIIDECHVPWKALTEMMESWDNLKFVGLSATPYTKGLGLIWQDMLVPITQTELLQKGYLCPVHYYGGRSVSTKGVRNKKVQSGGYDYHPDDIATATENDNELIGDIIRNWLEHGEDAQTIAFCPSIKHSKALVDMFNAHGIPARHIDGYTEEKERKELYAGHDSGEFKILSCSKLLGVGYDSPKTRVLIDCSPTKSAIAFQQRAGRIQRTHDNKEYGIYLDHAQNTRRFGLAHTMEPDHLSTEQKKFKEQDQLQKKEKKEAAVRDCPSCKKVMQGIKCECGYEIRITEALESDHTLLTKIDSPKTVTKDTKTFWYSQLVQLGKQKGYANGWAAHKYREKFGVWPRGLDMYEISEVQPEVINFVLSRNIAWTKRKAG